MLKEILNLVKAVKSNEFGEVVNSVKAVKNVITENNVKEERNVKSVELLSEVHYDEYIGYGYMVDKAFKPADSHAGEVALLCTYAPHAEYGEEGVRPYIAVLNDDDVYCAVEEYKESNTFDGAISIESVDGIFLFKAKREYYEDMMYFYGFELDDEEAYWSKAGLCLVYSKEYVGKKEEEKLMQVLDEAAKSFGDNYSTIEKME